MAPFAPSDFDQLTSECQALLTQTACLIGEIVLLTATTSLLCVIPWDIWDLEQLSLRGGPLYREIATQL